MCGIAGIVFADPAHPVDERMLVRMGQVLRHRGPDGSGTWTGPGVGLSHRRLSIIDLSPAGHQPMPNEQESVWVVFNGEIYNFLDLREELIARGHTFRSRTDTEVIVHLYEDLGPNCIERLHGMFAIAIWDVRRRRLVLARDRVGKKPLKYAELDGGLMFASELKAILATGLVQRDVELGQIHQFLSLQYIPSPGTGFRHVKKLPPGHKLVWENGRVRIERYWSLDFRRKAHRTIEEWKEAVRQTVRHAVDRRLISDVPLGAFLSGGIDSSIIVACMAEASERPVETFSIGFEFEEFNELPYARQIADRFGTSHHEFVVRPDAAEMLPTLAELYEEPYSDSSALPSYFLARETRRFVTVALNGDGGDEGFAGYERYAEVDAWSSRLGWLRPVGIRALADVARRADRWLPSVEGRKIDGVYHLSHPDVGVGYAWKMRIFSDRQKAWFYGEALRPYLTRPCSEWISSLVNDPRAGNELVDRMLFTDTMSYLPEDLLVKVDIACMAHSLEARSPLLDHQVLELAASVPVKVKYHRRTLKWLLKEAFRDVFPPGLMTRRKQGFAIPLNEWFRGPLLPMTRDLLTAGDARLHAYLRPAAVRELVERHAAGRDNSGALLWALTMLELWHRQVVEGAAVAATM
jgi:asparagine synthase (glutamine-hydrolysing)